MIRPDFREFQGQGLNELLHYGMPRRSGRYPWGSGDRPYQSRTGLNELKNNIRWTLVRYKRNKENPYKKTKKSKLLKSIEKSDILKQEYKDAVLKVIKKDPEFAKKVMRDRLEYIERRLRFGEPNPHGWNDSFAEKVFQESLDEQVNDLMADTSKYFESFLSCIDTNKNFKDRVEAERVISDNGKYEKKEVARFRTGIEMIGRQSIAASLGTVGGITIGAATGNPLIGTGSGYLISMGVMASPVGKMNIYFKK